MKFRITVAILNILVLAALFACVRWGWGYLPNYAWLDFVSILVILFLLPTSYLLTQWMMGVIKDHR